MSTGKASANGSVPKGKKKGARPDEEMHGPAAAPASASAASTNTSSEGTDVLAKEFQILAKEVRNCLIYWLPTLNVIGSENLVVFLKGS